MFYVQSGHDRVEIWCWKHGSAKDLPPGSGSNCVQINLRAKSQALSFYANHNKNRHRDYDAAHFAKCNGEQTVRGVVLVVSYPYF